MGVLLKKITEVLSSVAPILVLVIVLNFTLTPIPGMLLGRFFIGALFIVVGLSILLFGIDIGIFPFGSQMGTTFLKSNKLWFVVIIGFLLGFFINIAEPDLHVLADQVSEVTGHFFSIGQILMVVSIGTGVMLALGIARIVYNVSLVKVFAIAYGGILILAFFASPDMLAIAFDSSGATTGALTVPLVLALSTGVAAMKMNSKASEEDSFGLVGIMSVGAIVGVLALNLFIRTDEIVAALDEYGEVSDTLMGPFASGFLSVTLESLIALGPIFIMLIVFQHTTFHLHKRTFNNMMKGFLYTFIGLVLFLVGVKAGFMEVGNIVGYTLGSFENKGILIGFGFLLGALVILSEPAVYVLTHQIESVTSGYIKRSLVLFTLAIGVAFAVGLAMLRIVLPDLMLWQYLLPGYIIAIVLMFVVPRIFVGIAFDSGGVASGPMTATFILAFAQGAADAVEHANVLLESFGVIAMVAMTPLIALQILGLVFKIKSIKTEV